MEGFGSIPDSSLVLTKKFETFYFFLYSGFCMVDYYNYSFSHARSRCPFCTFFWFGVFWQVGSYRNVRHSHSFMVSSFFKKRNLIIQVIYFYYRLFNPVWSSYGVCSKVYCFWAGFWCTWYSCRLCRKHYSFILAVLFFQKKK